MGLRKTTDKLKLKLPTNIFYCSKLVLFSLPASFQFHNLPYYSSHCTVLTARWAVIWNSIPVIIWYASTVDGRDRFAKFLISLLTDDVQNICLHKSIHKEYQLQIRQYHQHFAGAMFELKKKYHLIVLKLRQVLCCSMFRQKGTVWFAVNWALDNTDQWLSTLWQWSPTH